MSKSIGNMFIIGFPFRTIEMLKDKNEHLEISIDTLEKSNSVLHQSNNNLQQSFDCSSTSIDSIASQIVKNSIAGAKGFVLYKSCLTGSKPD